MHVHFNAAIHTGGNQHVPSFQGYQLPGNHVAGAESDWLRGRKENVASTNSHAQKRTLLRPDEGRLQQNKDSSLVSRYLAHHRAAIFVNRFHRGIEYVLKADKLGHTFLKRRAQDLMGSSLRNDAALLQHEYAFP